MIPTNASPLSILMLWTVVSMGIMLGAQAGYHADGPAETVVEYESDSMELTVGNETIKVYDPDGEMNQTETEQPIEMPLSERGERWLGDGDPTESTWVEDDPGVELPERVGDPLDNASARVVNQSVNSMMEIAADVGHYSAQAAYRVQDDVPYSVVWAAATGVVWVPFIGAAAVLVRRVRS